MTLPDARTRAPLHFCRARVSQFHASCVRDGAMAEPVERVTHDQTAPRK